MSDDTTSRAEFEAWISAPPFEKPITRRPGDAKLTIWPGQYKHYDTQLTWEAWQARDAEVAAVRKTADYWKQEHLAGNAEIAKLQDAVRAIAPKRCEDCEGAGHLGRAGESALAGLVACDSCGGHEDSLGRGFIENQDVDYAEWMARPEVRRAIASKAQAEPGDAR